MGGADGNWSSRLHQVARVLFRGVQGWLPEIGAQQWQMNGAIREILVFARLPNPTYDYYLKARLAAPGMPPFRVLDIHDPSLVHVEAEGRFVLICRYANRKVVEWINNNRQRLAGVGLFVDDDIKAVITGAEAKLGYKIFLYVRGLAPLRRLNRHLSVVWTATDALAGTVGNNAMVMPPAPSPDIWLTGAKLAGFSRASHMTRIVYHATGIHRREHTFLRPIMERILTLRENVLFEVVADDRTCGIWAGLDRVKILRPVSWTEYLERTMRESADIMLVPLLGSRVNRVRAGTKRIDAARLGAACVFSRSNAYGNSDDMTGEIRLPNEPRLWEETLIRLIDDQTYRGQVARATRRLVEDMTADSVRGIPEICASLRNSVIKVEHDIGHASDEASALWQPGHNCTTNSMVKTDYSGTSVA